MESTEEDHQIFLQDISLHVLVSVCSFKNINVAYGSSEHIEVMASSDYECYLKVRRQRNLATSAAWNQKKCFGGFAYQIEPNSDCLDCRACLFSGFKCLLFYLSTFLKFYSSSKSGLR